ncbi:ATP-binding cassette sub- G member 2 [Blyttiomyces sp. JEL0837]|nr:ATP-binding cassette sub- G member 2 [Blyttiomyces sp. JEL0837]
MTPSTSKDSDTSIMIPTTVHSLEWKNISYEIPVGRGKNKTTRQLLKNISGQVVAGEMVAILGSSGAGKTTLLNCLSGRLSTGNLSGTILYDNQPRNKKTWKSTIAFVEQEDVLFPLLTVRETIQYAARLRLPNILSMEEKQKRVEEIIRRLRLSKAADTRIGDAETRGISGGEKKRTAIAQELVGSPEILFLDEPTSGLDSNSALSVMEHVKNDAAETNRIVIATIHQPSYELLCLFDKIILLSAGSTVYFGTPTNTLDHFKSLGYEKRPNQNPADFFMDMLTIDSSKSVEEAELDKKRIALFHDTYAKLENGGSGSITNIHQGPITKLDDVPELEIEEAGSVHSTTIRQNFVNNWFTEFGILFERAMIDIRRDTGTLIGKFGQAVVLILIIGFAFFQLKTDQRGIYNRGGILFFWPINQVFSNMIPTVAVFPLQRAIMLRERSAGSYRVSSFFTAKVLAEAIPATFFTILTITPLYYMIGLRRDSFTHYLTWVLIQWVEVLCALSLGFIVGAAIKSVKLSQLLAPLVGVIFLLFGGGLLNNSDLPKPFTILQWLSPINYAYRANMINEFDGATFDCPSDPLAPCYKTGAQVLDFYSLTDLGLWSSVAIQVGLVVGYLSIAYTLLRVLGKPKTKLV